jgi:tetratricopeptide (TPR) repeat protein
MARGATKRGTVAKPDASAVRRPEPQRSSTPAPIESQLFFTRIRRRAKWVFVFLAVVFAGSFVLFGVGSGSSGLGDLLNGSWIFGGGGKGSSTPGIRKAQKLVAAHPRDPIAYQELASAYQAASKPDQAIAPLTTYATLRPKDSDALSTLASLYAGKATRLQTEAQATQQNSAAVSATLFLPDTSTPLGQALAADPINQALQSAAQTKLTALSQEISDTLTKEIDVYQKLVALDPQDPTLLIQLAGVYEQASNAQGAITSYKRFLKIAPDDPSVSAVKQRLKSLEAAAQVPASSVKTSG